MTTDTLTIPPKYCGPSQTGNGGYVSGLLAARLGGPVTVRLVKGVPLDVRMRVETNGDGLRLLHEDTLIASARRSSLDLQPPPAPSFAEAESASHTFFGHERHVFARCFVCGTDRQPGDGLRIHPGAIPSRSLVAGPWVPHDSLADATGCVRSEFLWATLECAGGVALFPQLVVMGELTGRIDGTLKPGERCVSAGWQIGQDGRKYYAGTALYGEDGRTVAVGHATWIEIARDAFKALVRTGKSGT